MPKRPKGQKRPADVIGNAVRVMEILDEAKVVELFAEARTKDAAWAKEIGMINAIRESQIPSVVPIHSLVFAR